MLVVTTLKQMLYEIASLNVSSVYIVSLLVNLDHNIPLNLCHVPTGQTEPLKKMQIHARTFWTAIPKPYKSMQMSIQYRQ